MLSYEPEFRPSIEEINKHPWMLGPLPTKYEIFDELSLRQEISTNLKDQDDLKKKQQRRAYNRGIKGVGEENNE